MSSNVISKNKVVVQDDFFNEIVNGFKSPVEEKLETQDAKNSRVQLGGKQLALFKSKVVPIFGKEIEKNKMVHDYMQHVSDSYEQKKIQKLHNDFVKALKEYTGIKKEADDEIEDMANDKKGQEMFLLQGFRLFRMFHRIVKIYDMYKQMKAQLEPENNKRNFDNIDINYYDLNDQRQRDQFVNQLNYKMNEKALKYVPMLRPLLKGMTKSIFQVGQKAFKLINDAIYLKIMEIIAETVLEVGAAIMITAITQGRGAGTIGAAIASFFTKIRRIVGVINIGAKFTSTASRIYKMGSLGRGAVRSARAVGRVFRQTTRLTENELLDVARFALEHRVAIRRTIEVINAGSMIYDMLNVDDDDLNEIRKFVIERTEQTRQIVESEMSMLANDIDIASEAVEDGVDAFNSTAQRIAQRRRQSIGNIKLDNEGYLYVGDEIQSRYSSEIRIKNLNFDFDKINTLNDFLQGEYLSNFELDFNLFYDKDGSLYKFKNVNIKFDSNFELLEWISDATNTRFHLRPPRGSNFWNSLYFINNNNFTGINEDENPYKNWRDINLGENPYRNWSKLPYFNNADDSVSYKTYLGRREVIVRGNCIRLRQTEPQANVDFNSVGRGVQLYYGSFGGVTDIKINFEFNSKFLKTKDTSGIIRMGPDEWLNARNIISFFLHGYTSGHVGDYIQNHLKSYLFLNGQKVDKIIINDKEITVDNQGDFIDIKNLQSSLNQNTISKRDKNGNIIEIKTFDFHEVLSNRNDIVKEELKFNEKIKFLWNRIDEVIRTSDYDKLREAAIRAIESTIVFMRTYKIREDTNNLSIAPSISITYQRLNFGDKTSREVVEQMSVDDLTTLSNISKHDINAESQGNVIGILNNYNITTTEYTVNESIISRVLK